MPTVELRTPRTNIRVVGAPRRIRLDDMTDARLGSIRYDWTPWDAEQLDEMERQWDEWAAFYKGLLPNACRVGVNLGTHNGAIQKALQRAGFDMFGVEYTDHIEELHRYGCEGVRGNFFNMPHVETGQFDFAIIDRALCSNRCQSWTTRDGRSVERERIRIITDLLGRESRHGPPFFDDVERIIRPGGTLIISFRTYLSRLWIDDLGRRGELSIMIDNRKHPYYICVLKTGTKPTQIKKIEAIIDEVRNDFVEIVRSPLCARIRSDEKQVRFLYMPNNRFVTISKSTGASSHIPLFDFHDDTRARR